MYPLIAAFPIILCLFTMSVLNWNSIKSIGLSLVLTILSAVILWKLSFISIFSYGLIGFFETINIILIIFGAILLLNTLVKVNAMEVINKTFSNISSDARIQVMLIGMIFNGFFSGISGFAVEVSLSTLILMSLRFPAFPAVVISLAFNAPAVTFGAVGLPVIVTTNLTQNLAVLSGINPIVYANQISYYTALFHCIASFVLSVFIMFMVIKVFAKDKSWKSFFEIIPFTLLSNASMMIPYLFVAKYVGADLPAIIGGLIGLFVTVLIIKSKLFIPKNSWHFQSEKQWPKFWIPTSNSCNAFFNSASHNKIGFFKAWLPYILVSIILIVTRIPNLGLQELFKQPAIHINHLFGLSDANYTFNWLYSPGIMPFLLISIFCIFWYKMQWKDVKEVYIYTFAKIKVSIITLILAMAMVQIMLHSNSNPLGIDGMLTSIAKSLTHLKGAIYIIVSPIIGTLGTFVSGSNTTSNILFSLLQYKASSLLNISPYIILALQNTGGGLGDMFSIKSVVILTAVSGLIGAEGKIIKYALVPAFVYLVTLCIIGLSFYYF
ncbi:L-lactate permease [Rickettsiales bacterium LUAb2]